MFFINDSIIADFLLDEFELVLKDFSYSNSKIIIDKICDNNYSIEIRLDITKDVNSKENKKFTNIVCIK